jgi:hypothetical protein
MRRQIWFIIMGIICGLSCGFCGPVAAQSNPYGDDATVTNPTSVAGTSAVADGGAVVAIDRAWVNVRSGPGVDFKILNTLARGSKGTVIQEKNGWYLVQFVNGTKGWVRGDLTTGAGSVVPPVPSTENAKAYLEKEFERWDRHLGASLLDFSRFPWYWKLGRARRAFDRGDWKAAYELAAADTSNPIPARYLMAKALYQLGQHDEARRILKTIEKPMQDMAFLQVIDKISRPYIDEPVVFKFGGFDTLDQYRDKKDKDQRLGLESSEYYDRFVDINTWKWKSNSAYQEFQKIGGLDCSGYVQRLQMEAFAKAGVKFPIAGRTSVSGFVKSEYSTPINPGYKPPPPPDIRPGDMILLDYGHNRYGHSMIYRGKDAAGNIRVTMMGNTAVEGILAPEKIPFYKGTYRMNGMDKVREALTA